MRMMFGVAIIAVAVFPVAAANEPIPWAYAIPSAPPAGTPPAAQPRPTPA